MADWPENTPRPVVDLNGASAILGVGVERCRQLAVKGVLVVAYESVIRP